MEMPLIISDSEGRLLYKSRSVKTGGFLGAWRRAASKASHSGIVFSGGKSYYLKELSLLGKKYYFFFDYSAISRRFDGDAGKMIDDMFNFSVMAADNRDVTLKQLIGMFSNEFLPKLYSDGIRVSVGALADNTAVHISPSSFSLCVALMVRLCADTGRVVQLSFANECGRVVVFCDGDGSDSVPIEAREVFEVMLYEAAAAAGFAVEKTVSRGKERFSLSLTPLDVSLLGFKIPEESDMQKLCKCILLMFL